MCALKALRELQILQLALAHPPMLVCTSYYPQKKSLELRLPHTQCIKQMVPSPPPTSRPYTCTPPPTPPTTPSPPVYPATGPGCTWLARPSLVSSGPGQRPHLSLPEHHSSLCRTVCTMYSVCIQCTGTCSNYIQSVYTIGLVLIAQFN